MILMMGLFDETSQSPISCVPCTQAHQTCQIELISGIHCWFLQCTCKCLCYCFSRMVVSFIQRPRIHSMDGIHELLECCWIIKYNLQS
jgi:hypothetical protein